MSTNVSEQFGLFLSSSAAPSIFSSFLSSASPASSKPRKRRSKLISIAHPAFLSLDPQGPNNPYRPVKPKNKPSRPDGPNATPSCSECGKKFWSWKALFGHMRCHPERQWRGMNPPVSLRTDPPGPSNPFPGLVPPMTEEDHEVAAALLMLANGPPNETDGPFVGPADSNFAGHFECSSCKKVFGSHQALGGHRASHKNVKGCFANSAMLTVRSSTGSGLYCCENIGMVSSTNFKNIIGEFGMCEDSGGGSISTRLVMNSFAAAEDQACGVDLSLRIGL